MDHCQTSEEVVRAIQFAHIDTRRKRLSSNLFKGPETSLSRLVVWLMEKILDNFNKNLHKPPNNALLGAGKISVADIISIGLEYDPPKQLNVVEDPTYENPSHALLLEKISKGLANKIIKKLMIYDTEGSEANIETLIEQPRKELID